MKNKNHKTYHKFKWKKTILTRPIIIILRVIYNMSNQSKCQYHLLQMKLRTNSHFSNNQKKKKSNPIKFKLILSLNINNNNSKLIHQLNNKYKQHSRFKTKTQIFWLIYKVKLMPIYFLHSCYRRYCLWVHFLLRKHCRVMIK